MLREAGKMTSTESLSDIIVIRILFSLFIDMIPKIQRKLSE